MKSDQDTSAITPRSLTKRELKAKIRQALREAEERDTGRHVKVKENVALARKQEKNELAKQKQLRRELVQENRLPSKNPLQTIPKTAYYPLFRSSDGSVIALEGSVLGVSKPDIIGSSMSLGFTTFLATSIPAAAIAIGGSSVLAVGVGLVVGIGLPSLASGMAAVGLTTIRLFNRNTASLFDRMEQESRQSFVTWLEQRYGIHISDKTFYDFRNVYIYGGHSVLPPLVDTRTGSIYFLISTADKGYKVTVDKAGKQEAPTVNGYPQLANNPTKPTVKQLAAKSESILTSALPKPLNKEYEAIVKKLAAVQEHELDIEMEHAVGRIQTSMDDGVAMYEKLVQLDRQVKGKKALAELFAVLTAEVEDVITAQEQTITRGLRVETQYVTDRRMLK
jgi:hypothetical protein